MKRRTAIALTLLLVLTACSASDSQATTAITSEVESTTTTEVSVESTTTTEPAKSDFPVTVTVGGEEITVEERPVAIVSLSPTATETLFAIGAGPQVAAVDQYSDYPADAPITDLSGFTPNIEAIASFEPDLIIVSFDPDSIITDSFAEFGVPVVKQFPASGRDDVLAQIEQLGALTGHLAESVALTADMAERWDTANQADAGGTRVYIEVDSTFYAASSFSFMGSVLVPLGYENIADEADVDGYGFPQLNAEFIVTSNPDLITLTSDSGITADDIGARPGWDAVSAVAAGNVVIIDSDLSSRWGPRFIEYVELMAELAGVLVSP